MEQVAPFESSVVRDAGAKATVTIGKTTVGGVIVANTQGAACFVQLFNALLANVTLGTTVPDFEVNVAANAAASFQFNPILFRLGVVIGSSTAEKGATPSAAGVEVFVLVQ